TSHPYRGEASIPIWEDRDRDLSSDHFFNQRSLLSHAFSVNLPAAPPTAAPSAMRDIGSGIACNKWKQSDSITCQFRNRLQHIRHLRQNRVFQLRRVGYEGIEGADAADGSVEVFEQFAGDARGDFGAVTPRQCVFVSDDHARGFLD